MTALATPFRPAPVLGAVPTSMLAPELVHPDEPWENACQYPIDVDELTDTVLGLEPGMAPGRHRALECGLVTQGGAAGLRAHVRVCHRTA